MSANDVKHRKENDMENEQSYEEIMQEAMKTINSKEVVAEDNSDGNDAESAETNEVVDGLTEEEEPSDSVEKHEKKNSLQARIDKKHKEMMLEREKNIELQKKLEELESKIAKISTPTEKKEEVEETSPESVDDLLKIVEKLIETKFNEKISKAKEDVEHQTKEQRLSSMRKEFANIIDPYYQNKTDDVTIEEMKTIANVFNSNPEFWLNMSKKSGAKGIVNIITGKYDADTKIDKLKDVVNKKNNLETIDKSANVSEKLSNETDLLTDLHSIFKTKFR